MTPVQLPEVPEPFIELMTHTVYDAWAAQLRAYATEAVMAERRRVLALAEKWRALADKFAAAGGDIAIAEAASMRNDANELEAALRLSAGADSARLDALEALVDSQPDKALLLHHGQHGINGRYAGLGLSNTRRTLREAIDQAAPRHDTGEG